MTTQAQMIEADLRKGVRITPISAFRDYNCLRLGARIWQLRQKGLPILRIMLTHPTNRKKHYACYFIAHAK
jgi:hypothetical protein